MKTLRLVIVILAAAMIGGLISCAPAAAARDNGLPSRVNSFTDGPNTCYLYGNDFDAFAISCVTR